MMATYETRAVNASQQQKKRRTLPHIRIALLSHQTVAIWIVGGIVDGVVQGILGMEDVRESLAGRVAAWQKALRFCSKRKHFEVQVSCSTGNLCNCKLFTSLAIQRPASHNR